MGNGPKCEQPIEGYIILVGVNADGEDAGYGVIREEAFGEWLDAAERGKRWSLLYGGSEHCDTFVTFEHAMQLIDEVGGRLVNVLAAVA